MIYAIDDSNGKQFNIYKNKKSNWSKWERDLQRWSNWFFICNKNETLGYGGIERKQEGTFKLIT